MRNDLLKVGPRDSKPIQLAQKSLTVSAAYTELRTHTLTKCRGSIDASIQAYHPDYWNFRKTHLLKALENGGTKRKKKKERER